MPDFFSKQTTLNQKQTATFFVHEANTRTNTDLTLHSQAHGSGQHKPYISINYVQSI